MMNAHERGTPAPSLPWEDAPGRAPTADERRAAGRAMRPSRARRRATDDADATAQIAPGKETLYRLFAQICHARDLETRDGAPSLEKLAVASGLGKGTLSNIIRTPYIPKAETLNKVSAFAGWDEDLLLRAAGLRGEALHAALSAEQELILDAFRGADRRSIDYALTLVRAALQYAGGGKPARGPAPAGAPDRAWAGPRTDAPAPPAPPAD